MPTLYVQLYVMRFFFATDDDIFSGKLPLCKTPLDIRDEKNSSYGTQDRAIILAVNDSSRRI